VQVIDFAVVSGAGRGIGKAVAMDLAARGVPVLCLSRTESALRTVDEIRAKGGQAEALVSNGAEYEATETRVAGWAAGCTARRIAVVLAAGALGPCGPLAASSLKDWDLCYRVNVLGNLAVLHGLLPLLLDRRFGRIVFFAGGGAAYAYPVFPAYAAAKSALVRVVENLHEDLAGQGNFAVVCLAPGAVETDMHRQVRAAGAEVKTLATVDEPVRFVWSFASAERCAFSGCFVHVRDDWQTHLDSDKPLAGPAHWKLRRVER
jgi:3-oxoacyl-[acyl-carrier protein] reductase